jgi:type IX secretion system PorP/SprF family membrane protein
MIRTYILILLIANALISIAQQTPLTSLAYKDRFKIIPAYAGMEGTLMGSAIYRNQWQNLTGHPQGIDISIHCPIYKLGASMGLSLGKEEIGLESHTFIKPSFHKVSKINDFLITAGIEAEFYWTAFNSESARTPDGDYSGPDINHADPGLSNNGGTHGFTDFGLSVYAIWNRFHAGVAIEKILESNKDNKPYPWSNRRNLTILCAADYMLFNLNFQTQVVLHSDFLKLQSDLFTGIDYNGSIFGGIHMRGYNGNSLESLGLSLGFSLSKNIQLAYCHEFYIGSIPVSAVSGSQEIGLFYNLGKAFGLGKSPRIIHSPRYSD